MRKIIFTLMVLLAGSLLFVGGGTNLAAAAAEDIELDVWIVRDNYAVDLEAWNRKNPQIKINYEVVPWERTLDQLLLTAGTDRAPDVSVLDNPWISILAGLDHLLPLDDLIAEHFTQEELADFAPASWDFVRFNGKTYAMPFTVFGRALFYRADWFEEAGIEPPQTWDDVISAAKKLQDPEKDIWGLSVRGRRDDGTVQGWLPIFYAMGGKFEDEVPQIDSPAGVQALKLYQDLVWREKIMSPDTVSFGSGEARGMFMSGNAVMSIIGSHIAPAVVKAGIPYGDFKLTHIPVLERGTPPSNVATSFQWAILSNSEHPEAAMKFLKYVTDTEGQVQFNIDYMEAVRASVYEVDRYIQAKPWVDFIKEDQKNMRPLPMLPQYRQISEILQRAIQEMLRSPDTAPQAVAANAQQQINEVVGR